MNKTGKKIVFLLLVCKYYKLHEMSGNVQAEEQKLRVHIWPHNC